MRSPFRLTPDLRWLLSSTDLFFKLFGNCKRVIVLLSACKEAREQIPHVSLRNDTLPPASSRRAEVACFDA